MTSIDWLVEQLTEVKRENWINNKILAISKNSLAKQTFDGIIEEAKKLNRQEHSKTWDESMRNLDVRGGNIVRAWDDFDEHYEKMINNK
jgi:hypothetical protein